MGSVTDHFSNLDDLLTVEFKKTQELIGKNRIYARDILIQRVFQPLFPKTMRFGTGTLLDIKDHQAGPWDVIGATDQLPLLGDGLASLFLTQGVLFALQAHGKWEDTHLSQLTDLSQSTNALTYESEHALFLGGIGLETPSFSDMRDYFKSDKAQHLDGFLSLGHFAIVRNRKGWYGDPVTIPFVSVQGGPEALKAFCFLLLTIAYTALHIPSQFSDYQHL